jgi:hypothetical protein
VSSRYNKRENRVVFCYPPSISQGGTSETTYSFSTLWGYFFIFLYVYIFIFPAHPGKEYFIYFSAGHPEKMYFIYFQAGFPSGYVFYISIFYLFSPQARWAHLRLGLISRLRGGYFTYFPSAASRRYFSYFYIFWPPRKDVFYLF